MSVRWGSIAPVVMKCFEKLFQSDIFSLLPPTFNPHQFACRASRSTEDAGCCTGPLRAAGELYLASFLWTTAWHWMPSSLTDWCVSYWTRVCLSLRVFGLKTSCQDTQRVRVDLCIFTAPSLSTRSPQGCVLSTLCHVALVPFICPIFRWLFLLFCHT